jgi:hypothetical protein
MIHSKYTSPILTLIILLIGTSTTAAQSQFPTENFFYHLKAKHSGLYLDVQGRSISNFGNICQFQLDNQDQQKWLFVKVKDNAYRIISKNSGLCLDVQGRSMSNLGNVCQFQYDGHDQQVWILEPTGERNFFRLKAKHSGLYLDVQGQSMSNLGNVCQFQYDGLTNQVWELIRSDAIKTPQKPLNSSTSFNPIMYSHARPSNYQAGITGIEWISCLYTKDPTWSFSKKMKSSPWYYLERSVAYVIEGNNYWNNANNSTPIKRSAIVTQSWTKSRQKSFSVTTSIEAKAGGDNFGGSVTSSLSMTAAFSSSYSETSEKSEIIEVSIQPNKSFCLFTILETYTLKRMDNSIVDSWTIGVGNAAASYPN